MFQRVVCSFSNSIKLSSKAIAMEQVKRLLSEELGTYVVAENQLQKDKVKFVPKMWQICKYFHCDRGYFARQIPDAEAVR